MAEKIINSLYGEPRADEHIPVSLIKDWNNRYGICIVGDIILMLWAFHSLFFLILVFSTVNNKDVHYKIIAPIFWQSRKYFFLFKLWDNIFF